MNTASVAEMVGTVHIQQHDEHGVLIHEETIHNLITAAGDQMYVARGSGVASPPAAPTGMRLGTGSTAPAKTGAGAAVVTKLTGGNLALDSGYPQASAGVATYKATYGPGAGTSASPITEVVLVNDTIATDTATAAANTISRVLVSGVAAKALGDTLTVTWTHTLLGQ